MRMIHRSHNKMQDKYNIPVKYKKKGRGGRQVSGWEGVNLEKVAKDMRVGGQYLRDVLRGRRSGSVGLFEQLGEKLGWGGGVVGVLHEVTNRRGNRAIRGIKGRSGS